MVLPVHGLWGSFIYRHAPHGSGKGCCLFGHGDHLGTDLGEAAADGCSSARGVLVGVADGGDEGDHPNKMVRGSQILLEGLWSMMQDGLTGRKKVMMTFTFLSYSLFLQFMHKPYMFPVECHAD